jgi:hypothetical protein
MPAIPIASVAVMARVTLGELVALSPWLIISDPAGTLV